MKCLKYVLVLGLALSACKNKNEESSTTTTSDEVAQNIGDMMAGVDESGGSTGEIAWQGEVLGAQHLLARATKKDLRWEALRSKLLPQAQAVSCYGQGFGACSSDVITRNFNNCTVGLSTISGTVTLTWGGSPSNCSMTTTGDSITRNPGFTITGPGGGTFQVSKTGTIGQKLTWASGSGSSKVLTYTNDGIRRVVTSASGTTLYDYTAATTADITVTGTTRSNRVINGGTLRVTNNSNSEYCELSPSNVTWSSGCTCATSGTWSGTCSNGSSISLSISSCGSGTLSVGSTSTGIDFDRCTGT